MKLLAILIAIAILAGLFFFLLWASRYLATKLISHNERKHQKLLDHLGWQVTTRYLPEGGAEVYISYQDSLKVIDSIPGDLSPEEFEERHISAHLKAEEEAAVRNRALGRNNS